MTANSADGIRWNLNDLFSSHDDPGIGQTLDDCRARAERFSRQFRDRLENPAWLTPEQLFEGLQPRGLLFRSSLRRRHRAA
jgi:hypothetical protein